MSQQQVATQAIVGSNAVNNATVVTNLQSAQSNLIHVTGQIEFPQQGITYDHTYYQRGNAYVYPQSISTETTVYQFSTTNFMELSQVIIQVPVTFTFSTTTKDYVLRDPAVYYHDFGNWPGPAYPLLNFYTKIDVKVGSNNWPVDYPPTSYNQSGTRASTILPAYLNYYQDEELWSTVSAGLPFATAISRDNYKTDLTQNATLRDQWGRYLNEVYANAFKNAFSGTTPTKPAATVSINTFIAFPLKFISSFFQNTCEIPPNINIRIDINLNKQDWLVCQNTNLGGSFQNMYVRCANTSPLAGTGNQNILYAIVRQPVAEKQQEFNNAWIANPIVMRNNRWDYVDFDNPISSGLIQKEIQISTQVPTQLYFCVMNKSGQDQTLSFPIWGSDGKQTSISAFNFAGEYATGFNYSDITIQTAGFQDIYLRTITDPTTQQISNGNNLNAWQYAESLNNMMSFKEGYENHTTRSYANSFNEGLFYIITLQPNIANLNFRSTDPGAVTVTVSLRIKDFLGNPIDSTKYTPRVYRRLDRQTRIDYTGKVSQADWPAAFTSGTSAAIQQTFNNAT